MALDFQLFVNEEVYVQYISQLETDLTKLDGVLDEYNALVAQLEEKVMGQGDDERLGQLHNRADQQIRAIKAEIEKATATKKQLEHTLETMKDNARLMGDTLNKSVDTAEKVLSAAEGAANVAGTAAVVATVL